MKKSAVYAIKALIILAIAIIIPFYFHAIIEFNVVHLGIGWVSSTLLIRLIVMVLFVFALKFIIKIFNGGKKLKIWFLMAIGLVPGFFLSFAIEPIYDIDYFILSDDLELSDFEGLEEKSSGSYVRRQQTEVLAFFDVGCDHCQIASYKLGVNLDAGQKIPVQVFFSSDSANVGHFLSTNNGQSFHPHYLEDELTFVSFAGFEFPSIFLIDTNGKTVYHWIGERMNYSALDYLLNLEQ